MGGGSVSGLASVFTALNSAGLARSVEVATVAKANSQMRQEGEAVLLLIEAANLGQNIDTFV